MWIGSPKLPLLARGAFRIGVRRRFGRYSDFGRWLKGFVPIYPNAPLPLRDSAGLAPDFPTLSLSYAPRHQNFRRVVWALAGLSTPYTLDPLPIKP